MTATTTAQQATSDILSQYPELTVQNIISSYVNKINELFENMYEIESMHVEISLGEDAGEDLDNNLTRIDDPMLYVRMKILPYSDNIRVELSNDVLTTDVYEILENGYVLLYVPLPSLIMRENDEINQRISENMDNTQSTIFFDVHENQLIYNGNNNLVPPTNITSRFEYSLYDFVLQFNLPSEPFEYILDEFLRQTRSRCGRFIDWVHIDYAGSINDHIRAITYVQDPDEFEYINLVHLYPLDPWETQEPVENIPNEERDSNRYTHTEEQYNTAQTDISNALDEEDITKINALYKDETQVFCEPFVSIINEYISQVSDNVKREKINEIQEIENRMNSVEHLPINSDEIQNKLVNIDEENKKYALIVCVLCEYVEKKGKTDLSYLNTPILNIIKEFLNGIITPDVMFHCKKEIGKINQKLFNLVYGFEHWEQNVIMD